MRKNTYKAILWAAGGIGLLSLAAIAIFTDPRTEVMAAWVQAIGSILAIVFVTLPTLLERQIARTDARAMTLAAAEIVYGEMNRAASFYVKGELEGSEWHVPQWEVLKRMMASAPVLATGSPEALGEFNYIEQTLQRAEHWEPSIEDQGQGSDAEPGQPLDRPLSPMIISVMLNVTRSMETLRKELR